VPIYVVMLGSPGAGKGTQAKMISQEMGLPHVSSGDIFRENIKNETELGKKVKAIMDAGELVPDDVTIAMIKDRLSREDCAPGAVLDGFPRTPAQAEALEAMLASFNGKVDVVPYIQVSEDELVTRLTGRRTCQENGHIYNIHFNPPQQEGICDIDGSELVQREDDKAETVTHRIRVYTQQTAPLIEHYKAAGVLKEINGEREIGAVATDLMAILPSGK
jgi:adenylate kinase